jgi:serine/threonine protein kinase
VPLTPGTRLGPYEILGLLGAGGMGEVYRARDTRLDRTVAVKVSKQQFTERFEREARTVAALNHPNICTLHDVGPDYLVMEYVEGAPPKAPAPVEQVMQYALQIADGVSAAHAKGIVHRDLKPGNLFVTSEGRIKILDFGLATPQAAPASDSTVTRPLTDPGSAVGTVAYMSPEQARGEVVDARSDLWAVGVILYELLTGSRPFEGSTQAVIFEAILSKTPIPPSTRDPKIPPEWERIIARLLEKDRTLRYQSAQDLLADLKRLSRDSTSGRTISAPASRRRWPKYALAAAAVVVLACAATYFLLHRSRDIQSLAVLPFVNASQNADVDYLSEGITGSLIDTLAGLNGLKVRSSNAVRKYEGRQVDARQAGRELDVQAVLTGRIVQRSGNLSVRVELIDIHDNNALWSRNFERQASDALGVEQEIAAGIAEALRPHLSGQEKQRIARHETSNPEAYRLYLQGMYYASKFTKEGADKGLDYIRQAIAADPTYALAHEGLAEWYGIVAEFFVPARDAMPKMKAAALKAVELDDGLAGAHTALANAEFWGDFDWPAAGKEYLRSIELDPTRSFTHETYGWYLTCLGSPEKGIAEGRKAMQLDPLSADIYQILSQDLYLARHYPESIEYARKTLEVDPKYFLAHLELALIYTAQGKHSEAIAAAQSAHADEPRVDWTTGVLGMAYAAGGKRAEADKVLAEMNAKVSRTWVPAFAFAEIYAGMQDKLHTLDALEKTFEERSWFLTYLNTAPEFDFLRTEPRFQELVRKMRFPA